jgi:hypothetical protein
LVLVKMQARRAMAACHEQDEVPSLMKSVIVAGSPSCDGWAAVARARSLAM